MFIPRVVVGSHILVEDFGNIALIGHGPRLDRCWNDVSKEFVVHNGRFDMPC